MPTPLRVLILENQMSDVALMLHELRRAGFDPDWQRVETEADYLARLYTEEMTITPVQDERGEIANFIAIKQDVTERKLAEEKLQYLSTHDTLTGLYNRAFFEEELARLEHGRHFPVSVVMADVDDLKTVNDSQGHSAGDGFLQQVARVLRASFRAEDVVARVGGDEFAVLLPGVDAGAAAAALERLTKSLFAYNTIHPEAPLSLSLGTATAETGEALREALKQADARMYGAKPARRSIPGD